MTRTGVAKALNAPWVNAETPPGQIPIRGCVATGSQISSVTLPGAADSLPLLGTRSSPGGTEKIWALPATSVSAPKGRVAEEFELILRDGLTEQSARVAVSGLPKPSAEAESEEEGKDEWLTTARLAEDLVNRHIEAVTESLAEPPPLDSLEWRRSGVRRTTIPLDVVLTKWEAADRGDEPRHALIVRLAEQLKTLLPEVCQRPRVVLARTRELLRVERIQQLDGACLRWLVRQPGRTVIEKAGASQRVMGVARVEQADTHENRVVKDLLKRAIRASELYLREYRVHGNHFRVELVGGFLRTLRRQRQHSPIASVGSLVGIPGPNYVLQHDSRYSVLWQAYLQLVRHQDTLDSAWRWRDRVWSETVLLAVLSALRKDCGGFLNRNDALLHSEHVAGAYLDPAVALGPLTPSPNQRIDVLLGASQAKAYPGRLGGLAELFPDVLVISRPVDAVIPKRVVAIWAILDFSASSRLTAALAELARSAPKELAGLKLLAVVPGKGSAVGLPATVEVLSLPLPPQRGVAALGSTLKSALGFK